MKRHCTVGESRWKVWVLTTGAIRIDPCVVEFDSPGFEWICDPTFPWKRKSTHNKIDKCTGRGNYTSGANKQIVFRTEKDALEYKKRLELIPLETRKSEFNLGRDT